jgi:fatty acid desaturase
LFIFHYLSVITAPQSMFVASICATFIGTCAALLSFMPVHEGSHFSTTDSPIVWRLLGAVHDFVNGASFFTWIHQHFLGHHPYTNVTHLDKEINDSVDPDVCTNNPDIRRIKPHQKFFSHYRFQGFYVPILYGLLGIKYRINDIKIMFFSKMNGNIRLTPPNTYHLVAFTLGKLFFVYYRLILPCFYISVAQTLTLFLISDLWTSYMLAFVFQVNHVIPQAKWPTIDKEKGIVNMDWAEMQLATTLDYAHGSWWTTFMTGALNYQVTHHLFPYISQIHYPAIAPMIREHCAKHGVTYYHLDSFTDALKNHLKYLYIMGHDHLDFH